MMTIFHLKTIYLFRVLIYVCAPLLLCQLSLSSAEPININGPIHKKLEEEFKHFSNEKSVGDEDRKLLNEAYASAIAILIPNEDLPTILQSKELENEDPLDYYYGLGRPVDYTKARLVAYAVLNKEDVFNIAGSYIILNALAVLELIYADGKGVQKNIPIAKIFALLSGRIISDKASGVEALNRISSEGHKLRGAVSSWMSNHRSYIQFRIYKAQLKDEYLKIFSQLSEKERSLLESLVEIATETFKTIAHSELDPRPRLRSWIADVYFQDQHKSVRELLMKLEGIDFKPSILGSIGDGKINISLSETYGCIIQEEGSDIDVEELHQKLTALYDSILATYMSSRPMLTENQKSWLKFKDVLIRFACEKYSSINERHLASALYKIRIRQLKNLQQWLEDIYKDQEGH